MSNKAKNNRKGDVRRAGRKQAVKQRHERLFARIVSGEGQVTFTDITSHLGQPCPFNKPQAFMAVRASEEVCAFHLLHLSKKKAKEFSNSATTLPTGGLSRLERRAKAHNLTAGELIVEVSTYVRNEEAEGSFEDLLEAIVTPTAVAETSNGLDDLFSDSPAPADTNDVFGDLFAEESHEAPSEETTTDSAEEAPVRQERKSEVSSWSYRIDVDSSGLASISPVADEHFMYLDMRPVRASVYMLSPVTQKPVGLSFIGFLGKAGEEQALSRLAGKMLASALHLPVFQTVTGMTGVSLDGESEDSSSYSLEASVGKAAFNFRVFAFGEAGGAPEGSGNVTAVANLEYADMNRGRLHFTLEAEQSLGADFHDKYGTHVVNALSSTVSNTIGKAGMSQIIKDIVNGGVTADTVDQIVEAGQKIGAIDVAADGRWRQHS